MHCRGIFLDMLKPFVKWAGGKRQLLPEIGKRLPDSWNTYYEPFVGGGALLVSLHNEGRISRAVISDLNGELVNLYTVVKHSPHTLIHAMADEEFENTEDSFKKLKTRFNTLTGRPGNEIARAALLVYLNKHGYNGLWRVNSSGKFNVPFGRYVKRNMPSGHAILDFSRMLANVTIVHRDFEQAVRPAKKGDFVYFDPPYHPLSRTAHFTGYHAEGFSLGDQLRLAAVFKRLSKKGVQVMLSNSYVPEIVDLYDGFTADCVEAKRCINCNGRGRGGAREIIVTNYR